MAQVFAVDRENGRALRAIFEAVLGVAADVESRRDPEPQTGALVRAEKSDERFHGDQEDGLRREVWHRTCVRFRYRNSRHSNGARRCPILSATSLRAKGSAGCAGTTRGSTGTATGPPAFPAWFLRTGRIDRAWLSNASAAKTASSLIQGCASTVLRLRRRARRHLGPQQIRCGFVASNVSWQFTHARARANGFIDLTMLVPVPGSADFGLRWAR
jgi:hypothetical protein